MIKFSLDECAFAPTKAHESDGGWDLKTPHGFTLHDYEVIDTGVHIAIPEGYVGFVKGRSGLNMKQSIICDSGVIDSGYTGSIKVKLYKLGGKPYSFDRGDKICQLVILPINTDAMMEVESLEPTDRGDNGFGSTGK